MSKKRGEITRRDFLELGAGTTGALLVAGMGCSGSNSEENAVPKNVLVTYYSKTGNTEMIAQAISEEASLANVAVLKKLEDISPDDFAGYDIIFIGSPIHATKLTGTVQDFLIDLPQGSGQKVAGFVTHCGTIQEDYPEEVMELVAEPLKTACQEKDMEYMGCFNCRGILEEALYDMVKATLNLSEEGWDEWLVENQRHPNDEDAANAKAFANTVLA